MHWKINPGWVATRLLIVMLVLLAINAAGLVCAFAFEFACPAFILQLFFVDAEANIPSLYSSLLLILVAALSAFAGGAAAAAGHAGRRYWFGIAWIFVFLTVDEAASIHEKLSDPLREFLQTSGMLSLAWVVPYAIVVALLAVLYSQFVFRLPRKTRLRIIVAGLLYLSGALGFELAGAYWASVHGAGNGIWVLLASVEEMLEMSGLIVMIYALLGYLNEIYTDAGIRFVGTATHAAATDDDWKNRIR